MTFEWCVVGCTIGAHSWSCRLEKCYNGTPLIAGGFLHVLKCEKEEHAREILEEFTAIAKKFNAEHGYA